MNMEKILMRIRLPLRNAAAAAANPDLAAPPWPNFTRIKDIPPVTPLTPLRPGEQRRGDLAVQSDQLLQEDHLNNYISISQSFPKFFYENTHLNGGLRFDLRRKKEGVI